MNPELSIIIPCYNCQENISVLLRNIYRQLTSSVEVILINDGSKDDTVSVINQFLVENQEHDINLYSFENQGAAKARTEGLKIAKGNYVFFVDSDDNITPNALEIISNFLREELDMLYFTSIIKMKDREVYKMKFEKEQIYSNPNDFLYQQLAKKSWSAAVWTYVFRRNLALDKKAIFTDRVAHEDHLFTMILLANSKRIQITNELIYEQDFSEGSLTRSNKSLPYIEERYIAYRECKQLMQESKKFTDKTINKYSLWSINSFFSLYFEKFGKKRFYLSKHFWCYFFKNPQEFINLKLLSKNI